MRASWKVWLVLLSSLFAMACGVAGPGSDEDEVGGDLGVGLSDGSGASGAGDTGSGAGSSSGTGAGDTGSGGSGAHGGSGGSGAGGTGAGGSGAGDTGAGGSGAGGSGGSGAGGSGGSGTGGSGGVGGNGCYTEGWDGSVSLSDLQSGYSGNQWLSSMLETLGRRYSNGWYLLDQMKTDPWLTSSFPQYFELGSWGGMIEAIDTACHEESHGYDFDESLGFPGEHLYYMGSNLEVIAPELSFFPRYEILSAVQQGGSVTSMYDSTYLTGTQGSYDFIFLADELTAYINGLACATAVADHLGGYGYSFRDGAASHLYYLQIYLRIARTQHPSLYNQWRADADWQQFVRFSWARGHFWTDAAMAHANLGINDAAIWARINQPANLDEIEQFTGEDPASVACNP